MSSNRFVKATRKQSRLRMAIDGPSGSGKSFSALRIGMAMAARLNTRAAVIQTERGAIEKYQGLSPDGITFDFDVLDLTNYAPTEYTAAIEDAAESKYGVLIIDSLSHAWVGEGGALEIKDKQGGNSFTAWKNVTPMHNRMIEAILGAPLHVIVTMRSKTEYVIETNDKGQSIPRKIGLAPVQRAGMEYEFDIYASIDHAHLMHVTKSRCFSLQDLVLPKPGLSFADKVVQWVTTGESPDVPEGAIKVDRVSDATVAKLVEATEKLGKPTLETLAKYGVASFDRLTQAQADELLEKSEVAIKAKERTAAARAKVSSSKATDKPDGTPPVVTSGTPQANGTLQANGTSRVTKATDAQLSRLKSLRSLGIGAKAIDASAQSAWWLEQLKPWGVTSAKDLISFQADEMIEALGKQFDLPGVSSAPAPEPTSDMSSPDMMATGGATGFTRSREQSNVAS